jgi:queuosine precursor transporter
MNRRLGAACLAGYILTIFAANWAISRFGFVSVWPGIQAPAGVYFAGLALVLRDAVQVLLGRRVSVAAIPIGAALSWFVAPALAVASGTAFLLSESADWAVFTPLQHRGWNRALVASTIIGACVDSAVFLWLAFHSLEFWQGQVVGKLTMTLLAVMVCAAIRPFYAPVAARVEP